MRSIFCLNMKFYMFAVSFFYFIDNLLIFALFIYLLTVNLSATIKKHNNDYSNIVFKTFFLCDKNSH